MIHLFGMSNIEITVCGNTSASSLMLIFAECGIPYRVINALYNFDMDTTSYQMILWPGNN